MEAVLPFRGNVVALKRQRGCRRRLGMDPPRLPPPAERNRVVSKREAFARSVRAFVHRCALAAGVDLPRPDIEDEAARTQVRRFEQIPLDPEALLVLAGRWREPEAVEPFDRWVKDHARLLLPARSDLLADGERPHWPQISPVRHVRGSPLLRRPSNVWARARVGFGLGARAAVVASVCGSPRSEHPIWRIAQDSGLSERSIRDAAADLWSLGFVSSSRRGTTVVRSTPALDLVRQPAPTLHGRRWTTLLRFLDVAEREFTRADEDPVGLDDPDGELGGRRRLRRAAIDANIYTVAEMTDPSGAFRDPDPMAAPLNATRRFLELLEGW